MIKVYQTKYGKKNGNCFQACIASLFELSLQDVPDFCSYKPENKWFDNYLHWLHKRGYSAYPLRESELNRLNYKDCILLVCGKNNAGVNHAVLYKNGKIIHNPNKNCKGIKPDIIDLIFPLDPAKRI